MSPTNVKELTVYSVEGHHIVHAPLGRGEELRHHLASHGVASAVSTLAEAPFDRLELEGAVDADAVQALLDNWER